MPQTQVNFYNYDSPVATQKDSLIALPNTLMNPIIDSQVGIKAIPRKSYVLENSYTSLLLIGCFMLVAYSYKSSSHFFQTLFGELFENSHHRSFYQKGNLSIFRLKVALLIMTFLIQGVDLFIIFQDSLSPDAVQKVGMALIAIFSALALILFLFLLMLYFCLGNIFTTKAKTNQLLNAFTNTTILNGMLLFIPVLVAIYHSFPDYIFVFITLLAFFLTRVLFISSVVKIFFRDFYTLIYVVLYLCTFEIAPWLVVFKGLKMLFRFVELKLF